MDPLQRRVRRRDRFRQGARDPGDPTRIDPAYDSGDHLHPNDAGYQAMSDAVDLSTIVHQGQYP
jgi:lysophospholipase L1-like esterase